MTATRKNIIVSLGDPLGIGPEVTLKALSHFKEAGSLITLVGTKQHFDLCPTLFDQTELPFVNFVEVPANTQEITPKVAGEISISSLKTALAELKDPKTQALVTAPLSKTHAGLAGLGFPGHTEFLCNHYNVDEHAMMLFHDELRVTLVTIHKPLRDIFSDITPENVASKIKLTANVLQNGFGISKPKIAVCGLNPHASENGLMGTEENETLSPVIESFSSDSRLEVTGPWSADTVFYQALKGDFDAVICHYHDQGLIPIKTTGFEKAVNMTLGLPIIRTSPDHGTAFDIAGQMVASERSMVAAMKAAQDLLSSRL